MATRTAIAVPRRRLAYPESVSGLEARLLASHGLFQLSTLGTVAAANADPVGAWLDVLDPNVLRWIQATAGKRPTLLTSATPNGKPAVRFTAASSQMLAATTSVFLDTQRTVIVAIRPNGAVASTTPFLARSNNNNWYAALAATNRPFVSYTNGAAAQETKATANGTLTADAWHVIGYRWAVSGSDVTVRILVNDTTDFSVTDADGMTTPSGTAWVLGALQASSNFLNGDIAELDYWGRALTDAEFEDTVGEVMVEYGIT